MLAFYQQAADGLLLACHPLSSKWLDFNEYFVDDPDAVTVSVVVIRRVTTVAG